MSTEDLPYRAEYAKSSRASCRSCKTIIQKETLRLAVMVQVFHILINIPELTRILHK